MTKYNRLGVALLSVVLAACGAVPGVGGGKVDSNACSGIDSSDAGRKIKAFLKATEDLDKATAELENNTRNACMTMAGELGIAPKGDTAAVCKAVADAIRENLKVGIKTGAKLDIQYKPAECNVSAEAKASAAAACEGSASASSESGSSGSGECAASAEVEASLSAECTPPEFDVKFDAGVVVDTSKVEKVVGALKKGMPELLSIGAKAKMFASAAMVWAKTAKDLAASAKDIAKQFAGKAGLCVSSQLAAAASVNVEVRVEVSVQASAEVGGAAGAGAD